MCPIIRLIKENPAKGVKLPSKGSSKAQINYNKEQIWELIDAIKTEPFDKQVLFWIAFITSAREAEIAALDDNSILIDECAIRIDKSLGEMSGGGVEIIPTKNHLEGVAAIPETLMVMVEKLLLDKKKWKMLMRISGSIQIMYFYFAMITAVPFDQIQSASGGFDSLKKTNSRRCGFMIYVIYPLRF